MEEEASPQVGESALQEARPARELSTFHGARTLTNPPTHWMLDERDEKKGKKSGEEELKSQMSTVIP